MIRTWDRPFWVMVLRGLGLGLLSFALFFALSLVLILGYTISYVVNPLRALGDAIDETVRTGRPSRSTALDQSSHIGRFAQSFNQMQHRLTGVQAEILDKNEALNDLNALNAQHVSVMENVLREIGGFVRHYGAGGAISDYGSSDVAGLHWQLPDSFQSDPQALLDSMQKASGMERARMRVVKPNSRMIAGSLFQIDISLTDKREFSLSAHQLSADDHFYFCSDVTEIKRIESDLVRANKMDALGVMASGISHDFNNLLLVATAALELSLIDEDLPEPQRARLQTALDACLSGADVIRSMLDYARSRDTGIAARDLSQLAAQVVVFAARGMPPRVRLVPSIQPGLWAMANRSLLETSILNLINNARDALAGRGTIWLRVCPLSDIAGSDGGDDMVAIVVEDSGPGVPPAMEDRIFAPFFTTKEAQNGTGLGLSLVAAMANDAGGRCVYERSEKGGARFIIQLPAALPETITTPPAATEGPARIGPAAPRSEGAATILVIEDDATVASVVENALQRDGWRVLCAASVGEARNILEGPDAQRLIAILSDEKLPDGSGLALCRPYLPHLPVIMMSGKDLSTTAADYGCDDFLHKPFPMGAVSRTIRDAIARRTESQRTH